ncbi:hypothetical protein MTR67_018759 [Solanum verrucosum]|uniref:Prokaryotic-type class I peptide chain release factors domain-containing protein n=1 Tax=Solanum verrucosum TaxID=315347 RepID=A0AAF0TMY8_SOLVR|nr:hypothetical protein MTR67_018759 [Solanum verrucosum]
MGLLASLWSNKQRTLMGILGGKKAISDTSRGGAKILFASLWSKEQELPNGHSMGTLEIFPLPLACLTSFTGIEVMPLLPEDSTNVEIPEEALDISFTRAGGKGGQNVNKVETAVRITHIPTGVAVRCTEERSQLANKIKALSRLKAKLLVIAEEQRASEIKQIRGDTVKAEWGQQIRNYVFHPYKLVKDVRTAYETSDITSVMDGELDPFIKAYLKHKYSLAANPSGLT